MTTQAVVPIPNSGGSRPAGAAPCCWTNYHTEGPITHVKRQCAMMPPRDSVKRRSMHHTEMVEGMRKREQALSSRPVDITATALYWPVRQRCAPGIDPDLKRIVDSIQAGYRRHSDLDQRLCWCIPGLQDKLNLLQQMGVVTEIDSPDGTVYRAEQNRLLSAASTPLEETLSCRYLDVATDFSVPLPKGCRLLRLDTLDSAVPVLGGSYPEDDQVVYVLCVAMLVQESLSLSWGVRVYCDFARVNALEEVLLDLIVEGGSRLAGTPFAARRGVAHLETLTSGLTSLEASIGTELEAVPVELPHQFLPDHTPVPTATESTKATSVGTKTRGPQVVPGRRMHEHVLFQALEEARERILIVTPFVRARLREPHFLEQLRLTLKRSVNVTIVHGMPIENGFDDTSHEDRRIWETHRALGRTTGMLKFHRVTLEAASRHGEHSKILICDSEWAVVSSFNWLSIPETNETGILVFDRNVVEELLRSYGDYL